jgi:hypothetical protein
MDLLPRNPPSVLALCLLASVLACQMDNPAFDDGGSSKGGDETHGSESTGNEGQDTQSGDGDGDTAGDGDGDTPGDGDGDTPGDGDGDTPGDGDGEPGTSDTGDGDGEPGTSDTGDGDGDPNQSCNGVIGMDPCTSCLVGSCCSPESLACMDDPTCMCMIYCLGGNLPNETCVLECGPSDDALALLEAISNCALGECGASCQQP